MTSALASTPRSEALSLGQLAAATRPDRNRAIDAYRAIAMLAVAFGHWMAIHVATDGQGGVIAGNALEFDSSMHLLTWLFQVMPLFFVVGGFSSAMSLDAFTRGGSGPAAQSRPQDWVAARLRRMVAPTMTLATTWLVIIAAGLAVGQGELVATGAVAASIPLWFLANYTIDTAIAPWTLPLFRRHPVAMPAAVVAVFAGLEAARFAGLAALPHFNWVLGWLLFQIAGFAWRDGLLPSGRRLVALAAGLWTAAIAAVTVGPWPVAMVHFPGLENSPTHPPSLALLLFGGAYSATAIAAAPVVNRWLEARPRAWAGVVAANAVAMSVYLWHFTAAIAATAVLHALGWLPTAGVGTGAWWMQKLPLIGLSTVFLAGIVAAVMGVERRALLAPRAPWVGGPASMLVTAGVLSLLLKQWAHGDFAIATACLVGLVALWYGLLRGPAPRATN